MTSPGRTHRIDRPAHGRLRQFLGSRAGLRTAAEVLATALVAAYFFLTTFGFTEGMLDDDYTAFDLAASDRVYELRTDGLTGLAHAVSFLGAGLTFVLLPLLSGLLVLLRRRAEAVLLVGTTALGLALNLGLKGAIGRPRPSAAPLVAESFAS